jgi:hypothetical protein
MFDHECDFCRELGLCLPISRLIGRGVSVCLRIFDVLTWNVRSMTRKYDAIYKKSSQITFFSSTFFLRRQMVLTKANSTRLPKMKPVQPMNQISDALM